MCSSLNHSLISVVFLDRSCFMLYLQKEESHIWTAAHGRDMSALQANFFYNFAQGQQVTFLPGQGPYGGMYPLTAPATAPSIVQSLPQRSQATSPAVESAVPPPNTHQQPHSQINWNPKLLNRENI